VGSAGFALDVLTRRRIVSHGSILHPRGGVPTGANAPKILIAYEKAVPVQFEGLERPPMAEEEFF
jgi:hypothetical protein